MEQTKMLKRQLNPLKLTLILKIGFTKMKVLSFKVRKSKKLDKIRKLQGQKARLL